MSYTNLLYHIVYATKDRAPVITNTLRPRLHEYLGGTIRGLGGVALEINGVADHVHILAKTTSDNFGIRIPQQIKIWIIRLGEASNRRKIWLASEIRSLHRKRVASRASATIYS